MSHAAQMEFFRSATVFFSGFFAARVIDIGALDINGGPHSLFSAAHYVGVDIGPGLNVDLVSRGEDVDLPTGSFDVAMSSECFEHNPEWRSTFQNMVRLTRPGGLVIFSCATEGRKEHGTSRSDGGRAAPLAVDLGQEYYQNVPAGAVRDVVRPGDFARWFIATEPHHHDLFFVGLKSGANRADISSLSKFERLIRWKFTRGYIQGSFAKRLAYRLAGNRGLTIYRNLRAGAQ